MTYTRDGIEVLPTPLAPMLVADLKLEGQKLAMCRHRDPLPDDIARAHKTENGWRINITPSRVKRQGKWGEAMIRSARSVVAGISMKADAYLGPGWGVSSYIWDYSGPTKANQFPHHIDTFYGFRALKVYVFLTDCRQLNGALEYAPGLHAGTRLLMEAPAHLKSLDADNSFDNLERIYGFRLQRPTHLNGPAGTVVLFDPAGPHGSGPVRHGERYIFRAHLVERAYVLRHLPDQLPWYLKPISKAMRWMNKPQGGAQ